MTIDPDPTPPLGIERPSAGRAFQWTRGIDRENGIIRTTRTEMASVLQCAAAQARHDRMHRTAERLASDAVAFRQLAESRPGESIIIVVSP